MGDGPALELVVASGSDEEGEQTQLLAGWRSAVWRKSAGNSGDKENVPLCGDECDDTMTLLRGTDEEPTTNCLHPTCLFA